MERVRGWQEATQQVGGRAGSRTRYLMRFELFHHTVGQRSETYDLTSAPTISYTLQPEEACSRLR